MTVLETVRVAAVQATPVILDLEASVDKTCRLLGEAAGQGAKLAVLPETFLPLYPSNAWAQAASSFAGWDELWTRLWENSVDVDGPEVARLAEACRDRGQRARIPATGHPLQRPVGDRSRGRGPAPPQADADPS